MIRFYEELSMNAWPALQTELYDGWVMRFADGYTKRSNSVNPIYPSTLDCHEKIDFCESLFSKRNIPLIFKLTPDPAQVRLDALLDSRGYRKIDETSFRVLDLGGYKGSLPDGIKLFTELDDSWYDDFFRISDNPDKSVQKTARRLLDNIKGEILGISKISDGQTVGCALGVIEQGHIGVFDVIVSKPQRGLGYGRDILDGLLTTAKEKKVKTSYLQVMVGNTIAENLYDKLGYREIYRYWYRVRGV